MHALEQRKLPQRRRSHRRPETDKLEVCKTAVSLYLRHPAISGHRTSGDATFRRCVKIESKTCFRHVARTLYDPRVRAQCHQERSYQCQCLIHLSNSAKHTKVPPSHMSIPSCAPATAPPINTRAADLYSKNTSCHSHCVSDMRSRFSALSMQVCVGASMKLPNTRGRQTCAFCDWVTRKCQGVM